MRLLPVLLAAAFFWRVAAEPVSKQFGLDLHDQMSTCFRICHYQIITTVPLPGLPYNYPDAITRNCAAPFWPRLLSICLPITCISAPDVAYAIEFAKEFCRRGGVTNLEFNLPQWYLDSPGGAYYNSTLESAATHAGPAWIAVVVAAALAALV